MKKALLLLLIMWLTIMCAQVKKIEPEAPVKVKFTKINNSTFTKFASKDTIKTNISEVATLITVEPNRDVNVILVKEPIGTDWSKYLMPIFTLLLGVFLTHFLNYIITSRKIKRNGERWVMEIQFLKPQMELQIEELNNFLLSLRLKEWNYNSLAIVPQASGKVFKSLDKSDLLHYIEKTHGYWWFYEFKSKAFRDDFNNNITEINNQTHFFLTLVENQNIIINKKWEDFLEGISKATLEYNLVMQKLAQEMLIYSYKVQSEGIDIYNDEKYSPLFSEWEYLLSLMRAKDFNPLILEAEYLENFANALNALKNDDKIIPVAILISPLLNKIRNIKNERDAVDDLFMIITDRYLKIILDVDRITNNIESYDVIIVETP